MKPLILTALSIRSFSPYALSYSAIATFVALFIINILATVSYGDGVFFDRGRALTFFLGLPTILAVLYTFYNQASSLITNNHPLTIGGRLKVIAGTLLLNVAFLFFFGSDPSDGTAQGIWLLMLLVATPLATLGLAIVLIPLWIVSKIVLHAAIPRR